MRMVRMTELPSDWGRPVTRSKEMCDQGLHGPGRGCSSPERRCREVLFWAQIWQVPKNSPISFSSNGHQNRCLRKLIDRRTQLSLEDCPHCRTLEWRFVERKKVVGRAVIRRLCPIGSTVDSLSIPQVTTPTTQEGGRMVGYGSIVR